ncbi:MAG: plasmid stabilization protein [Verrucomicrobia bacterium]|nr:plasmid stabilization protein [Verrucomicrobiota bacterium]
MAQLLVRDLEDEVVVALRSKAAEEGTSVEEAHRRVLRDFAGRRGRQRNDFKTFLLSFPEGDLDEVFERQRNVPRQVDLA